MRDTLETDGIACEITRAETEPSFLAALEQGGFDLILADYTLPSFDGLSALKIAKRQHIDTPFIFVSGTMGEEVAIEALTIGATDYVLKSRLSRLVPAVRRALREAAERAERKRAEEAARRSESELRDLIENVPAMVFIALPGPSNVFVSRPWREYTGRSSQDTAGFGWQSPIHPGDLERHIKKWKVCSATGEPFEDEARFRRAADGEYRWFLVRAVSLRDERGEILRWYGVLTDIQDRKRAEEERERLRQLETDLAHMNRVGMMGELAASLAHEIIQPMAAAATDAKTCLRWLQQDIPDLAEARGAASRVAADVKRAAEIIERNRSLYRRGTPRRELVILNEIISEMAALLKDRAIEGSIAIRTQLAESSPTVMADRVQVRQVLMNLMLNGIEAMKETGGELTITSATSENGQSLTSVRDSGIGIPAEHTDRIFEAFFTTKPQGTGMGLSISRTIIESHGGRLWASANTERGVTFHFTLPSAKGQPRVPATGT